MLSRIQAQTHQRSSYRASHGSVQSLAREGTSPSNGSVVQENITEESHPPVLSQVDNSEDVRRTWKVYREQQRVVIRDKCQNGTVSRVWVEWCCRCKATRQFSEQGWCMMVYCQHERCSKCRDMCGATSAC